MRMKIKGKIIIIGILMSVTLSSVIGFYMVNRGEKTNTKQKVLYQAKKGNTVLKGPFTGQKRSNNKDEKMLTLNVLRTIVWDKQKKFADVGIYNDASCRFAMKVCIKTKAGKVLYESPVLQPDERVEYAILRDESIKNGTYDCLAEFFFYDNDELVTKQTVDEISVTLK